MLIPALTLVEQDRHRHQLDEDTKEFIFQSTREIVEGLDKTAEVRNDAKARTRVLCMPARDDADDILALCLSQLLVAEGYHSESIPIGTAEDMLAFAAAARPDVICISALPPFAFNHARSIYLRLRSLIPDQHIVICVWNFKGNLAKLSARLKLAEGDNLFTNFAEPVQHLRFRSNRP